MPVEDNGPVAPVHKWVVYTPEPPTGFPFNVRFIPSQAFAGSGVIADVGLAFTVTVMPSVSLHPLSSVTL
jgi:hypothetical protein